MKFALLYNGYDDQGCSKVFSYLSDNIENLIHLFIRFEKDGVSPRFYNLVPVDDKVVLEQIETYRQKIKQEEIDDKRKAVERLKKELDDLEKGESK